MDTYWEIFLVVMLLKERGKWGSSERRNSNLTYLFCTFFLSWQRGTKRMICTICFFLLSQIKGRTPVIAWPTHRPGFFAGTERRACRKGTPEHSSHVTAQASSQDLSARAVSMGISCSPFFFKPDHIRRRLRIIMESDPFCTWLKLYRIRRSCLYVGVSCQLQCASDYYCSYDMDRRLW